MSLSTTVDYMLSSAKLELPQHDSEYSTYASGLTELDILCAIVQLTTDSYYDYIDLSTFRDATSCTSLSSSDVSTALSAQANLTGKCVRLRSYKLRRLPCLTKFGYCS